MALFNQITQYDDEELTLLVDDSDPLITYFGRAKPGSNTTAGKADGRWQIWGITSQGFKLWAAGSKKGDKIWDSRAGYSYS